MTQETVPPRKRSNSYNIFIFVLTILSLAIMVVLLLPLAPQTLSLLRVYDNLICVIFLIDFAYTLFSTPKKSDYFIKERGWLDLLGSIPALGITQYGGLLRLARLSRLARIARLMKGENKKELVKDVLQNRSQYAAFITILLTILVLTISSVLVLQFESRDPASSIQTGADALWYSIVTITTVGYGDFYPVTGAGADRRHVHHVCRCRHHRRPGQPALQPAGRRWLARSGGRRCAGARGPRVHRILKLRRSNRSWPRCTCCWKRSPQACR